MQANNPTGNNKICYKYIQKETIIFKKHYCLICFIDHPADGVGVEDNSIDVSVTSPSDLIFCPEDISNSYV